MMCFFFNDTATTEIYTLSLHDALPICRGIGAIRIFNFTHGFAVIRAELVAQDGAEPSLKVRAGLELLLRSEEHTSELQSRQYLVCRLLLEKNKSTIYV